MSHCEHTLVSFSLYNPLTAAQEVRSDRQEGTAAWYLQQQCWLKMLCICDSFHQLRSPQTDLTPLEILLIHTWNCPAPAFGIIMSLSHKTSVWAAFYILWTPTGNFRWAHGEWTVFFFFTHFATVFTIHSYRRCLMFNTDGSCRLRLSVMAWVCICSRTMNIE